MKNLMLKFCFLIFILLLACSYPYGRENYKKVNTEKLELGMTKEQVKKALGRGPSSAVGSKYHKGHKVEVYHYIQAYFNWYGGEDHIQYEYYLYFYDDELVQWGRPGDWEKEADEIIELRVR